jgi:hypothetical protein
MSAPIYLPDPFEGINKQLMQLAAMRQAQEAQKEQNKIEKEKLKIAQEKHAMEQQQQQTQQASAMQTFLGAVADPSMQQMVQPGLEMLGNAQVSSQNALAQVNAVAAPQQMGGKVGPSQIEAKRAQIQADAATERYMSQLQKSMTPDEFSRFQAVVGLIEQGVPKETVEHYVESQKDIADRLKVLEETRGMKDKAASDAYAQKYLAEKYKISVGTVDANKTLQNMVLADRAAAQARALEAFRQQGDQKLEGMKVTGELRKIQDSMRTNFEQSPVVKTAQTMASAYGRILKSATAKTGPSDQQLIFAFINMQDQTAARDSERQALQASGSIGNYITAKFGKWKEGTVLADEVRQKIVAASKDMLDSHASSLNAYMQWYGDIAGKSGLDVSAVMYNPMDRPIQEAETEADRLRLRNIMKNRVK